MTHGVRTVVLGTLLLGAAVSGGRVTFVAVAADEPGASELRTWTDAKTGRQVEAALVAFKDNKVQLQRADGRGFSVPIAQLSEADQKYVREELKRRRAASGDGTKSAKPAAGSKAAGPDDDEWSQWRWPHRDGRSSETGLLKSWP